MLPEPITVSKGDRKVGMSKQRAVFKTLVAKTLRGDSRSTTTLLNTMIRAFGFADPTDGVEQPLDANEQRA